MGGRAEAESLARVVKRRGTAPCCRASRVPRHGGAIWGLGENFDNVTDSLVKVEAEVRRSSDRVARHDIPFPGSPTQEFELFFQNKDLDDLLSAVAWNG